MRELATRWILGWRRSNSKLPAPNRCLAFQLYSVASETPRLRARSFLSACLILINHKKLRRLYVGECLQVRRRGGRKRAPGTRAPMRLPQGPNQRWSLDFVSDGLTDSRRFRILAVVDDFTRECVALVADTSLSSARVGRELDTVIARRGRPLIPNLSNCDSLTIPKSVLL